MTSEHQKRKSLVHFQLLDPYKQQYKIKRNKLLKIFSKKFGRFLVVGNFYLKKTNTKHFCLNLSGARAQHSNFQKEFVIFKSSIIGSRLHRDRGVREHLGRGGGCAPLATLCPPLKNPFFEKILIPFLTIQSYTHFLYYKC